MKTLRFILPALIAACFLSACIEEAELTGTFSEEQRQELAQEVPDNVYSAALVGMYNNLQSYVETDMSHNYFGQKSFDYLTSLMGNDIIMTGRYGMSLYHYLLDYWQENYTPTANRWAEYYQHITDANNILKTADPESDNPTVQKYRAIALAFRGYAYLQLTHLYQHAYYTGADDTVWGKGEKYDWSEAPCVPLITETTEGDQPRATVKAVYAQLIADLTAACELFEALGMNRTEDPTDMDGCVAAMYLARACMVIHDWDNAIKYSQVVMDNFGVLTTEADITQGFSSLSLKDVVFGCDITADNSTIYMSWFSQMDYYGDGYAALGVYRAAHAPLVDRIADTDVRLKWFCNERSTGAIDLQGTTYYWLRDFVGKAVAPVEHLSVKFIGAGRPSVQATGAGTGWHLGDYIYLRSEEAYLTQAEALAHKGDANAVTLLNAFMKTRQPDYNYTFTSKAELIEEIIFQKRVEFWGEGLEYLDNRRLNIPVDRTDATWGERNNHFSGGKLYAEQEDRCFAYQIPIKEIENNPMINETDQN